MSYPQSVTADVMPSFPALYGWRMPVFVTVSLLLHLAVIAAFLRDDTVPALLMAGAEGGVVAMTMVSVASHQAPATHAAETPSETASPEKVVLEAPSQAFKMPAQPLPDALITLPAASEKKRESTPRKVEKPQKKPLTDAPPVRQPERQARQVPTPQVAKPLAEPIAAASNTSGEPAAQTTAAAAGAASSISATKTGSSDSGRAQQGAGTSTSQNVKALHRRVNYPQRAKAMGVEGRIRVKFDITASGTITDVRVLSETPAGVFAAATIKDMARWRYQTQSAVTDQTVTIVFKLNGQVELEN